MKIRRLSNKILLTMIAVVLVISASFLIYFITYVGNLLENRSLREGMALIRNLALSAELGVLTEEERFLRGPFKGVMSVPSIVYVVAYDSEGRIIKSESRDDVEYSTDKTLLRQIMEKKAPYHSLTTDKRLDDTVDFYAPVLLGAPDVDVVDELAEYADVPLAGTAVGLVRIGMSAADIALAKRRVLTFGVSVSFAVFLITMVFVMLLAKRVTWPLTQLRHGVSRVAQGDLDFQISVSSKDEIGVLADAFNRMTGELQKTTVSKNYLDNILGSMIDTLVVVDMDGIIQTVNPALLQLLRYDGSEIVGKSLTSILAEKELFKSGEWKKFLRTGVLKDYEVRYVTASGELIPMSLSGSIMLDSQKNAKLIVGIAHDMREIERLMADLERRRDETEMARDDAEREQRRLMAILSSISEGVIMLDNKGEVVMVNPFARKLLRLGEDAELSKDALGRVKWLAVSSLMNEFLSSESKVLVKEVEVDFPVPQVIRLVISQVKTSDERDFGWVVVLHDVTEERQVDRLRDEFVITVSHDLRTPLTTIKGFVSLLLSGKVGDLGEKQKQFLVHVQESAQHLHDLINNLLDLSRIHEGKLVISAKEIDLRSVVEESVRLNGPAVDNKKLNLRMSIPPEPCLVKLDYDRFKEVLNNLISNAIKFTPEGGSIFIDVLDKPQECELRVRDTGVGIAKEYHKVIFDKFRSVGERETSLSTGLGLSIAKGIVDAHGGSIRVESERGKGSTFIVKIPKKPSVGKTV